MTDVIWTKTPGRSLPSGRGRSVKHPAWRSARAERVERHAGN